MREQKTQRKLKVPYIPLYTGDWLKDPELSMCSPATRGVWIDLLCAMHESDRSGVLRGTTEQLARIARCQTVELDHALTELQTTGAASVTIRNNGVTVVNRRMEREHKERQATLLRVRRFRDKDPVTPQKLLYESEIEDEAGKGGKGLVSGKKVLTDAWMDAYEANNGEPYAFNGAKDGQAADRLIHTGIQIPKLIEIAVAAWKNPTGFNCKHAASLAGFASRINEIRAELKSGNGPMDAATRRQHNDELGRVLQQITTLRATYSDNQTWDQKDRERLRALKEREKELKAILGVKV